MTKTNNYQCNHSDIYCIMQSNILGKGLSLALERHITEGKMFIRVKSAIIQEVYTFLGL